MIEKERTTKTMSHQTGFFMNIKKQFKFIFHPFPFKFEFSIPKSISKTEQIIETFFFNDFSTQIPED